MTESYHVHQSPFFPIEHVSSDCTCSGKQCSQCKQVRCIGNFHRFIHSKDGFRAECKLCRKAERETDKFKANRRAKHAENAEHINEKKREWSHAHPEQVRAHSATYRERNPEKVSAYNEEYNQSERGKRRSRKQARSERGKANRRRYAENGWLAERQRIYRSKEWQLLKAFYNNTCLRCGKQEPEIKLTPDHAVPLAKNGLMGIEYIQPLCLKCNKQKGTQIIDYRPNWKEGI